MPVDDRLLELIVCPDDKQPLEYVESDGLLYNPRLRRAYEVKGDIPVLLVDEARAVDDAQHNKLMQAIESGSSVRTGPKDHQ